MTQSFTAKIKSRDDLALALKSLRESGKKICFTSGVFDLLHRGHVEYLEKAKATADLLVVGVNADSSVKSNKGELRPIISELDRAALVAALACVDYVFVFSELNNNINIETLKPDVYAKAGDYKIDQLSSAKLVEEYGGRVELLSFIAGYSTSSIINKVVEAEIGNLTTCHELPAPTLAPAVFLDRDGTINESVEYLGEASKFKFIPGAIDAVKQFNQMGFRVVIVTNQPGIGMGYFTREDFYLVNRVMLKAFGKAGAKVDKVYFCPHSHAEECPCRKPKTEMLDRAVKDLNIDLKKSFVIGDTSLDMQMAKSSGVKSVLVLTGQAGKDGVCDVTHDYEVSDLLAAAKLIGGML